MNRLWVAFWSRAGAVSIQVKIIGIVLLCVFSSTIATIWYVQNTVSSTLEKQLEERGLALGISTAARSRDLILTHNYFGLHHLAIDTINSDQDIAYIYILDADGEVLIHTFDGGFPVGLLGTNDANIDGDYQIMKLQTENGVIQDMALPILEGTAGVVHLGMSEEGIRTTVASYVRDIIMWMGVILVVGIIMAYVLSRLLTKPVSQMVDGTRAMSFGNFRWKAPIWAKDEIGRLGTAFEKMCRELINKEEARKHLLAKVMTAQEEERKRIARELHDGTSQNLTSIKIGLKMIEESDSLDTAKETIREMQAVISKTLDEVHDLALELRPSVLDDVGLIPALQRYIKDYSAKMNIKVDSHISHIGEYHMLPQVETAIYRIVQEALTNVAKHAEAENVSIILEVSESSLIVIVEDDGKGFHTRGVMHSVGKDRKLGLFGMQERASLIGGKLAIESQPGAGTTIFFEIPLELMEVSDEQHKASSS